MKRNIILIIILVIVLGSAAVWIFGFRKKTKPILLETEKPKYGYISRSVTATGTIEPVDTVNVGTQVSGTIKHIYADFNDVVKKGKLLAELDRSLFEATANQCQANLELAKSNLNFQQSNFSRQTVLYDTKVISASEFESAKNLFETAKAQVSMAQAQLDAAKKNLSYASIYSPVNGTVLLRNISIGQTVAASFNTPTLFIIARDITKMQVQAAVDEADIGNVKPGQRVIFTVDAYPNVNFFGTVKQIRLKPAVSANVVTYTTIINAPNEDLKLKPGMTANIFIYTEEEPDALLIPAKALKFKPDKNLEQQYKMTAAPESAPVPKRNSSAMQAGKGKNAPADTTDAGIQTASVWVKSGDSLIKREIQTGINDDMNVQVLGGLQVTDDIVISQGASSTKTNSASPVARSPFMPARRQTTPSNRRTPASR